MPDFVYCLNSSTIRPTPLLRKIEVAGQAGYSAIELWHEDLDAFVASGGTLRDVRHALDDRQLTVPTTIFVKGWFDAGESEYPRVLDECRRRLDQAAEVGAVHIVAGPPAGRADRRQGARRYRELLELGLAVGVRPAMEFLGFVDGINTLESALEIVTRADHPAGTVVLDPFHFFRGGGSIEGIAGLNESRIAICHFNDAPAHPPRADQHDKDRVLPGEGHLDLRRLLDLLRQVGYRRWLSLELFREDLWGSDPLVVARLGLERMRQVAEIT
jgi:sugar phosphate isomerase/epimerase